MKRRLSWGDILTATNRLAATLDPIWSNSERPLYVFGVPNGGVPVAIMLVNATDWMWLADEEIVKKAEQDEDLKCRVLIVDDLVDTGRTLTRYREKGFQTTALYKKPWSPAHLAPTAECFGEDWLIFPWESGEVGSIEDAIVRQIQFVGDDPTREGLVETPKRVVNAWKEIFSGYSADPKSILKTFDSEGYDELVLLKDIEVYSMCEHHMLPFFGRAHVAYIPNGKIVGISKLARLVEVYSRRLQVQERLCNQITETLMSELNPLGAACIIEAAHMCMRMRGVNKQNSTMVTSSMKGVFMEKQSAREELMLAIYGGRHGH